MLQNEDFCIGYATGAIVMVIATLVFIYVFDQNFPSMFCPQVQP